MRVFKSCAAQTSRVESLTRPQSFGHLKVADRAIAFPRANPQLPSVGPLTQSIRLPTNQATISENPTALRSSRL
jgi:hypothetical protein